MFASSLASSRLYLSSSTMLTSLMCCCALTASLPSYATAFLHVPLQHKALVRGKDSLAYNTPYGIRSQIQPSNQCKREVASTFASSTDSTGDGDDEEEEITGVTLKMAFDSSSNWGVADLSETKSERFTSPDSLDMVHRLRRESCAVLVGRGTVERDDCSLTVRRVELNEGKEQPVRVIIDPSLSLIDEEYTIFNDELPTIVYHLQSEISKATPSESVTFVGMKQSTYADRSRSSISPSQVVTDLQSRGIKHLMVEGGPATAKAFLEARVVDRAILVRAPIEFEIPVPAEMDKDTLKRAGLQMIGTTEMGGDTVEYWTKNGSPWPAEELRVWP